MTRVSSTTTPALVSRSSSLHSGEVSKLSLATRSKLSLVGMTTAILSLSILLMPVRGLWTVWGSLDNSTFGHTCVTVLTGSRRRYVCSISRRVCYVRLGRGGLTVLRVQGRPKKGRMQAAEGRPRASDSGIGQEWFELRVWREILTLLRSEILFFFSRHIFWIVHPLVHPKPNDTTDLTRGAALHP